MRSLPIRSRVIRPRHERTVRLLAPSPLDFVSVALQRCGVAGESVPSTVALPLAAQRRVLVSHPPMTMRPAPLAHGLQRPAEAVPRSSWGQALAVLRFTTHRPFLERPQWWVNPNVVKLRPRCVPPRGRLSGRRTSTSRVLSGCRRSPFMPASGNPEPRSDCAMISMAPSSGVPVSPVSGNPRSRWELPGRAGAMAFPIEPVHTGGMSA